MFNLTDNDLKFTEEGFVQMGSQVKQNGSESLVVSYVKESGTGIKESEMKDISAVLGLGLTISKKYCGMTG